MNREIALTLLAGHKSQLQRQFGVRSLALFGSTARGTAGEGSDIDVLISVDTPTTSRQYFGAQFYLEDVFKCPVDLVTKRDCANSCARILSWMPCTSSIVLPVACRHSYSAIFANSSRPFFQFI